MAKPTLRLINALRETAHRLDNPRAAYKWSSFAHCNCGHLVQTVTGMDASDIQRRAMQGDGDWGRKARIHSQLPMRTPQPPQPDYGDRPPLDEGAWEPENVGACPVTGTPLDMVFDELESIGLVISDFQHLERLSDPTVRRRLGTNAVEYPHHVRENVVDYLRAWADLLEERLPVEEFEFEWPTRNAAQPVPTTAREGALHDRDYSPKGRSPSPRGAASP